MSETDKLIELLEAQLADSQPEGFARLENALNELQADFSNRGFFHAFALSLRWFDKRTNEAGALSREEWERRDPYGVLRGWQYPQLARLLILLKVSQSVPRERYVDSVNELYKTADVAELVLLGRSLAFLPDAEQFVDRARESARSNIPPVFSSVAHNSEYALRFFDQGAWNQLVLKAAFLAEPIWSIPGLKQRNNPELVTMLRHYVNERQAAGRSVPWDLWSCIGWQANSQEEQEYLQRQWGSASMKTQAAIALALSENPDEAARDTGRELLSRLHNTDRLSWPQLARWPD